MSVSNLSKTPCVSVVMPIYNVEQYIEQAVTSVLNQSFADFELLVIDDHSPDQSIQRIQRYTKQDRRLRIIRQENRGLAGARNTGIREAKGRFIAFLDSDDFWHEDKLKKHAALMMAQANSGVTFSASRFVTEQGQLTQRMQSPLIKRNYTPRDVFCRNPIGNGSAPVIRKSVLEQISFKGKDKRGEVQDYWQYFDETLNQSEDIDCWTRIALQTATDFALIDQPLTYYRLNNAGLSADVDAQYQHWLAFIDKLEAIAPDFIRQHAPAAKAFQCRYLARRCLSQAEGKNALTWCGRALKHNALALLEESKRSFITIAASGVFACLPKQSQSRLLRFVI